MRNKPTPDQYPKFFEGYISKTPEDILPFLIEQKDRFLMLLDAVPAQKRYFAYAEGKWTLFQSLIHVVEAERVFAYRSLALSRKETQNLPGFDQDEYVNNWNSEHLNWEYVRKDFLLTRELTIHQLNGYNQDQWNFIGTISGNKTINAALPYMIAGHVEHHIELINNRYLA